MNKLHQTLAAWALALGIQTAQAEGPRAPVAPQSSDLVATTRVQAQNQLDTGVLIQKIAPAPRVLSVQMGKLFDALGIDHDTGKIDTAVIEKKFGINLKFFATLYSGDTRVFEKNEKILELRAKERALYDEISRLEQEVAVLVDKDEKKDMNQKISELSAKKQKVFQKITLEKDRLALSYFKGVWENVEKTLGREDIERLVFSFPEDLTKSEGAGVFQKFLVQKLHEDKQWVGEGVYGEDVTYADEKTQGSLVEKVSDIPEGFFSDGDRKQIENMFILPEDVYNGIMLSGSCTEETVYACLADLNNDGVVSVKDKGPVSGKQLLYILESTEKEMIAQGKASKYWENLSRIFGENVTVGSRSELVALIRTDNLAKKDFTRFILRLSMGGSMGKLDLSRYLRFGTAGFEMSIAEQAALRNHAVIGKIMELVRTKRGDIEKDLSDLKKDNKINMRQYDEFIELLRVNAPTQKVEELIFSQALGVASNVMAMIASKNGQPIELTYSTSEMQAVLLQEMNDIVNRLELAPGFAVVDGSPTAVLGGRLRAETKISEKTGIITEGGVNLVAGGKVDVLPFIKVGAIHTMNEDELKKAGFLNYTDSVKSWTATIGFSNGLGLRATYGSDRMKALNLKVNELDKAMDSVFENCKSLDECFKKLDSALTDPKHVKVAEVLKPEMSSLKKRLAMFAPLLAKQGKDLSYILDEEKRYLHTLFVQYYGEIEWKSGFYGWNISEGGGSLFLMLKIIAKTHLPFIPVGKVEKNSHTFEPNAGEHMASMISRAEWTAPVTSLGNIEQALPTIQTMNIPGLEIQKEGNLLSVKVPKGENFFEFLRKRGVEIQVNYRGGVSSEMVYQNDSLYIGNVKNITILDESGANGRKKIIILGGTSSGYALDEKTIAIFTTGMLPVTSIEGVRFNSGYRVLYSAPSMKTQKFGI